MILNFSDSEAFAGEALVLEEIFLILQSSVWTSNIFFFSNPKIWEQAFPIGKPITNHFVIFSYYLTSQPIKATDQPIKSQSKPRKLKEHLFHVYDFNWTAVSTLLDLISSVYRDFHTVICGRWFDLQWLEIAVYTADEI